MTNDHLNHDHEELKKLLHSVPGVKEHLESFSVRVGKIILKRRLDLGLTQQQLVDRINSQGEAITQATISKIESGHSGAKSSTYDKIFQALGGLNKLVARFGGGDHDEDDALSL
ncbi:MAG TPA: helix-turn-helix transcriptional regulator [Bacilli bacterium]|nr:helix-turn-helix transcriptional regulator [Bacilli bacterium]